MVGQQPRHAVRAATFLVRRERQDQVSRRREALTPEPDERCHPRGRHVLHVGRAAAVEVPVPLHERERVHRPVLAPRLHDIGVREQQDRAALAQAGPARDEVAFAGVRPDDLHVGGGEAGSPQACGHRLGRLRGAAARVGRVDLDQFLEDVAGKRVRQDGARRCLAHNRRRLAQQRQDQRRHSDKPDHRNLRSCWCRSLPYPATRG